MNVPRVLPHDLLYPQSAESNVAFSTAVAYVFLKPAYPAAATF